MRQTEDATGKDIKAIRTTMEAEGIEFLDDGPPGVRLHPRGRSGSRDRVAVARQTRACCRASSARRVGASLNHLIRAREDAFRDRQPKLLGSLEVQHKLKLGRLFNWQVGRISTFEYFVHILSRLAQHSR